MLRREPELDVVAGLARPNRHRSDHHAPAGSGVSRRARCRSDGFDVVREIGDRVPAVVFVTAFDQYALRAFEVHAIDYLLKPFAREVAPVGRAGSPPDGHRGRESPVDPRLAALLDEVQERGRYLQQVPVRAGARIVLLDTSEVDWIQAANNYVLFTPQDGNT